LLVVGIMMAALLQTLDATIVNVALPTIEGNVGASIDDGIWIVTGYIISNVIAIPLAPFCCSASAGGSITRPASSASPSLRFFCGTATTLSRTRLLPHRSRCVRRRLDRHVADHPARHVSTQQSRHERRALRHRADRRSGARTNARRPPDRQLLVAVGLRHQPRAGHIAASIVLDHLKNPAAAKRCPSTPLVSRCSRSTLGSMQYVLDEGERRDWFGDGGIVFFTTTFVVGLIGFVVWELFGSKHPIVDLRVFRYRNVRRHRARDHAGHGRLRTGRDAAAVRAEHSRLHLDRKRTLCC
jgi:DHA2 family multidrug resistance protein